MDNAKPPGAERAAADVGNSAGILAEEADERDRLRTFARRWNGGNPVDDTMAGLRCRREAAWRTAA